MRNIDQISRDIQDFEKYKKVELKSRIEAIIYNAKLQFDMTPERLKQIIEIFTNKQNALWEPTKQQLEQELLQKQNAGDNNNNTTGSNEVTTTTGGIDSTGITGS